MEKDAGNGMESEEVARLAMFVPNIPKGDRGPAGTCYVLCYNSDEPDPATLVPSARSVPDIAMRVHRPMERVLG